MKPKNRHIIAIMAAAVIIMVTQQVYADLEDGGVAVPPPATSPVPVGDDWLVHFHATYSHDVTVSCGSTETRADQNTAILTDIAELYEDRPPTSYITVGADTEPATVLHTVRSAPYNTGSHATILGAQLNGTSSWTADIIVHHTVPACTGIDAAFVGELVGQCDGSELKLVTTENGYNATWSEYDVACYPGSD